MSNLIRRKISGQGICRRLFAALCLAFLLTGCQEREGKAAGRPQEQRETREEAPPDFQGAECRENGPFGD